MAELTILDGAVGTVLQNDGQKKVALNMGSAGGPLEPLGTLSFDAAYESYAQVVRAGDGRPGGRRSGGGRGND
ncbi:MAG: hypothetical protein SOW00_01315 [Oscillospiraceae bacterium]|nr:hypothetical protein [Oscillospiraceae bacterium]